MGQNVCGQCAHHQGSEDHNLTLLQTCNTLLHHTVELKRVKTLHRSLGTFSLPVGHRKKDWPTAHAMTAARGATAPHDLADKSSYSVHRHVNFGLFMHFDIAAPGRYLVNTSTWLSSSVTLHTLTARALRFGATNIGHPCASYLLIPFSLRTTLLHSNPSKV